MTDQSNKRKQRFDDDDDNNEDDNIVDNCCKDRQYNFAREKHNQYFVHCLKLLPAQYSHLDSNRLTLVHFAVQSLDILGFFDDERNLKRYNISKEGIINWIYSLQITSLSSSLVSKRSMQQCHSGSNVDEFHQNPHDYDDIEIKHRCNVLFCCKSRKWYENDDVDDLSTTDYPRVGFEGGTFLCLTCNSEDENNAESETNVYNQGHIAMTYTALCTLLTLGDDLHSIDKTGIVKSLQTLQQTDGSYQCRSSGSENDLRFLYCACAISYILNDWSGVDIPLAIEYIKSCRSYDGAYGLIPGQEGHGGSTFCAVASLVLMGVIDTELNRYDDYSGRSELIQWCVTRQIKGFQGRPNKKEDTCYSYWIGGTLRLLGCEDLLDKEALNTFVLGCQTDLGGFSKLNEEYFPDLLHSFYSLAWLSISMDPNKKNCCNGKELSLTLNPLDCALGRCCDHQSKISFLSDEKGNLISKAGNDSWGNNQCSSLGCVRNQ